MFKFENIFRKPPKKEPQPPKKELPTGIGKAAEPKETLPAVEVKNEVIWVNPAFPEAPFKLKEGEPAKLGLFLTPNPKPEEKVFNLKVMPLHGRSALVGQVIFKDIDGQIYRDLDLKGIGHVEFNQSKPRVGRIKESRGRIQGLHDEYLARKSIDKTEEFLKLGIRTGRSLALIKLENIIFIDEDGEEEMLPKSVVEVRALGTKSRISDINDTSLLDAKTMVAQELNKTEKEFSWRDYLTWFSETLGKNVGLMHKNYYSHGYLLNHNITLDCRIIDLDSVFEGISQSRMEKDIIYAGHGALHKLFNRVSKKDSSCGNFNEYLSYFYEAYKNAMEEKFSPEFLEGIKMRHEERKKRRKEKFGESS